MIAGQQPDLENELLQFTVSSVIWRIASVSLLQLTVSSVIWRIARFSFVARARSVAMSKGAYSISESERSEKWLRASVRCC